MLDHAWLARDIALRTPDRLEELDLREAAEALTKDDPYPRRDGPPLWPLDRHPNVGCRTSGVERRVFRLTVACRSPRDPKP